MAYITTSDLISYQNELTGGVQSSFSGNETAALQSFVTQAKAEIDRVTGRAFEADGTTEDPVTRYYWPEDVSGDTLYLDADLLEVVTLTNGDGTVIPSNGYWLLPDNTTPKSKIKLKSSYSWAFGTDGRINVAGIWGFASSAPDDIKRLNLRLAYFYWMKRAATGEATILNEVTTVAASEYPEDIRSVLARYRRGTVR